MVVLGIDRALWPYAAYALAFGAPLSVLGVLLLWLGAHAWLVSDVNALSSSMTLLGGGAALAGGAFFFVTGFPWLRRASWVLRHTTPRRMLLTVHYLATSDADGMTTTRPLVELRAAAGEAKAPPLDNLTLQRGLWGHYPPSDREEIPVIVQMDPNPGGPILIRLDDRCYCSAIGYTRQ